jgi:hypothetical protein
MHIEFLVEEESCAVALLSLVPRIVGDRSSFGTHVFQGKADLLKALPDRLKGDAKWLPNDWRIVVLVDRDDEDCKVLKGKLDRFAREAGLTTRTRSSNKASFQVLNRIAVEELEAWFFGDVTALKSAYPNIPATLASKRGFREADAIAGGTWEKLERVLMNAGYFRAGMPKIEVARNVSKCMDPNRNQSQSFQAFRRGLEAIVSKTVG